MQPPRVIPLRVGSVLIKPGSLPHAFGEIFREIADVPPSFLRAAEDALDMDLCPEADHVRGFGQLLTRLLPTRQRRPGVGISERFRPAVPDR